jgi:hypothetical protein
LKAFNGFQYEIGKTYTIEASTIRLGELGFHFCQYPVNVFMCNDHLDDRYALAEAKGTIINGYYVSVTN